MKKVVALTLGGTIAMKEDASGRANTAVSGDDLVLTVPGLANIAEARVEQFSNTASGEITFKLLFQVAERIRKLTQSGEADGIVIVQGTDTIEETSYFLDLILDIPNPVVVIGAMRNASEPSYDGTINIMQACRIAADESARNKGVLMLCNEMIHTARDVRKLHTSNVATFQSPYIGPIGVIDKHKVVFYRQPLINDHYKVTDLDVNVDVAIVQVCLDMRTHMIDYCVDQKVSGIIIDGFGRGHVPPWIVPSIERAIQNGIPVILTSWSLGGFVLDAYSHGGSAMRLKQAGVIFGGDLSSKKARIKLVALLGAKYSQEEIRKAFESDFYNI